MAGLTGLLVFGSLSVMRGLLATSEYLRHQEVGGGLPIVMPLFLVGGLAFLAAKGHRALGNLAGHLVILAMLIQLPTVSLLGMYL